MGKKELVAATLLSGLLILLLSNILWKVEITGVPTDIEKKITKELNNSGIHPGAWTFSMDSPSDIQQNLLKHIPELLWVGVEKMGTTIRLEGVEKIVVKKEPVSGPRDLVATKKGIIKKMYVSKGRPLVYVNDYVEPGEVLVSGNLRENENVDEEKEKNNRPYSFLLKGK
ncbi:sporulation protein YqfD [Virgibacillus sp. 179-BFC.A HS]|uniref:Sporulation protein YqfD n=1 Tax=Tigheibacillus jepli TaxID=3035914 RepID=A0ABU5CHV1_9BACI|nr:sporulation protein YqfD [Virgibacillus sp. 179-BFC.A HS]MDY0405536.1 sporulation protein YqfD [Virgibacillus sp. 179-BFC.A HS]